MTKEQVQTVIDNLTRVMPKDGGKLDMMEGHINTCGSPMCHAGWYALSKFQDISNIDYGDGAKAMAIDLGFTHDNALIIWAMNNPEIWDNTEGGSMFTSHHSF